MEMGQPRALSLKNFQQTSISNRRPHEFKYQMVRRKSLLRADVYQQKKVGACKP